MKKEALKRVLNKFPFVKWDRLIEFQNGVDVYGWIERDKDKYKDFVLLNILWVESDFHGVWDIVQCFTSSAKYSLEVNRLSGFTTEQHTDCIKVSDYLN